MPRTPSDVVRFGANYTPSQGWFHHWLDFDLDAVRADLDSIAALGLDHIRVFPIWPYFQPNRTLIRPRAVEQLVALADAAAARGLDVNVDGLQGHLSSFDFLPAWTQTWHRRNIFTDPDVVTAQAEYLRTLAAALADRPNFIGMTIGNEVNQFSAGPHPDPDRITEGQAEAWLTRVLAACEEGAPASCICMPNTTPPGTRTTSPSPRRKPPALGVRPPCTPGCSTGRRSGMGGRGGHRAPRRVHDRTVQGVGGRSAPSRLAPGGRGARAPHPCRACGFVYGGDGGCGAGLRRCVGRDVVVLPRCVAVAGGLSRT